MAYLGRTEFKSSDIKLKASTTISGSSTNTVVLTWTAPTEQSIILKVNGVVQHTDAYSIAGSPTTITLASGNFADGAVVEVVGINDIGTTIVPADGSVTRPKLATTGTPDGSKFLQDDMAWTTVDSLPSQTSQSGKFLTTNGSAASWAAAGGGYLGVVAFTGDGTYTVGTSGHADAVKQLVFLTGAGGSGANTTGAYGATAGGGAGTVIKNLALDTGTVVAVTIGASTGTATAGGDSTFNRTSGTSFTDLTAPGGNGGRQNDNNLASPSVTGGDLNIKGGAGASAGSMGGASFWGGGGASAWGSSSVAREGEAFGTGGGTGSSNTSYHDGKIGAPGVCFILEFK